MRTLLLTCVLALLCGSGSGYETDIDGISTSFETVPDDPLHRLIYRIKEEVDAILKDKPIEIALDDKPLVSVTPLTGIIDVNAPDCLTEASIRRICDSGRVCKLLGHRWITDDHLGASEDDVDLYQGSVMYGYSGWQDRECAVCGYKQSRHWTKWRSDAQAAQENTQEELRRVEGQLRECTEQVKKLTEKLEGLKGQIRQGVEKLKRGTPPPDEDEGLDLGITSQYPAELDLESLLGRIKKLEAPKERMERKP